jgi:hypothetical protein
MDATVALCSHHERALEARPRLAVPVLLVSGQLGSGKTSLLNHILRNKLNLRVTCLVNDLAALNVDAELLLQRSAAHKTVALSAGCVCHGLSGEFESEVWKALQETDGKRAYWPPWAPVISLFSSHITVVPVWPRRRPWDDDDRLSTRLQTV